MKTETSGSEPEIEPETRWPLIRDVLVFQVKLAVDAARDVVLVPISLGAALLDLLTSADRERPFFYQVLLTGRRSEGWINLFGEADRVEARGERPETDSASLDGFVERMESLLLDQYERGGVTAQAKDTIDRSLDALVRKRPTPPDEAP